MTRTVICRSGTAALVQEIDQIFSFLIGQGFGSIHFFDTSGVAFQTTISRGGGPAFVVYSFILVVYFL